MHKKTVSAFLIGIVFAAGLYIYFHEKNHRSAREEKMNPTRKEITVSASVPINGRYVHDLGYFGDEEGAVIQKQPLHFQESFIDREPEKASYTYIPQKDYIGKDEAEILIKRGSDGAGPSTDFTVIRIQMDVFRP